MAEDNTSKTHVFRKPCGCISCLILNIPHLFDELAKAQRYAKDHGETYEMMGTEAVRKLSWRCSKHPYTHPPKNQLTLPA